MPGETSHNLLPTEVAHEEANAIRKSAERFAAEDHSEVPQAQDYYRAENAIEGITKEKPQLAKAIKELATAQTVLETAVGSELLATRLMADMETTMGNIITKANEISAGSLFPNEGPQFPVTVGMAVGHMSSTALAGGKYAYLSPDVWGKLFNAGSAQGRVKHFASQRTI